MEFSNKLFSSKTSSNPSHIHLNFLTSTTSRTLPSTTAPDQVLSYHDISYTVKTRSLSSCCDKKNIPILKGLSGVFRPGLNAIMGPTGSGKSSLLDVLTGMKKASDVQGTVLLNGNKLPPDFNTRFGYVTQESLLFEELTVQENMEYSAALANTSSNHLLSSLGLSHCASNKVGKEGSHGISGGERKRCQIGVEMLKQPSILFLDEPTSGLDAHSAFSIVCLLHKLSLEGKTIILSMHQPRYCIFKLFSTLTILSHGHTLFHAPTSQALSYFNSLGYSCEPHDNPADFILDVITRRSITDNFFVEMFLKSTIHKSLTTELKSIELKARSQRKEKTSLFSDTYPVGFLTQLKVLSKRSFLNLARNYKANVLKILINASFAIIIGVVFLRNNSGVLPIDVFLQNRTGALFYILVNQMFFTVSEMDLFIKDRNILKHEHTRGCYRTSSFFLSKIVCECFIINIICTLIYSILTYLLIGLEPTFHQWILFFSVLLLVSLCCSSLCFFLSSLCASISVAQTIITFIFCSMTLLSGFLVNLQEMSKWMWLISHLSIPKYAISIMFISQLKDLEITVSNGTHNYLDRHSSNEHLEMLALEENGGLVVLSSFTCVLLIATYVCLRCSATSR